MSNGLCEPSSAKNLGLIIIPRGSSTANREEGDDEDDAVIFVMGVEKGCFCWIALYLKSQVAMVVVAEVVKRTFCVFCKHWRQFSSLRIGRRGSYSKCGRNYGKEEARVDPELGNYADFIHSSFLSATNPMTSLSHDTLQSTLHWWSCE